MRQHHMPTARLGVLTMMMRADHLCFGLLDVATLTKVLIGLLHVGHSMLCSTAIKP
jgi:hypothetical protein